MFHLLWTMQVLGASLTQVGKAKMLPYLAMFATSNAGAWFGDALIAQHGYSVASARKAVNSLGVCCPQCPVRWDGKCLALCARNFQQESPRDPPCLS